MARKRASAVLVAGVAAVALSIGGALGETRTKSADRAEFRTGAKLWPVYCARCHQAIPGSAYSPAQWDTIMLHMRSRASLTGEDATAIMKFLQAR